MAIPLAWNNLTHDPKRLLIAISGIAFAVTLMFMEQGFENALFDSTVKIVTDFEADVIVTSTARFALPAVLRFPRSRLLQAQAHPAVLRTIPVYTEGGALLKKLGRAGSYPLRAIGYPLGAPLLRDPRLPELEPLLSRPNTALIDRKSKRKNFPFTLDDPQQLAEEDAELFDKRLRLVGTFRLGTDFAHDGNLLMSDANFARYFAYRTPGGDPLQDVDLGVIQLRPGSPPASQVAAELQVLLGDEVQVHAKPDFIAREVSFWQQSTPIGLIFKTGVIMGLLVGVVICYQIIYSDIARHMSEFATLKAMGYTRPYFVGVVISQSIYLSLLGFVPGLLISAGLYTALANLTGLLMVLTVGRAGWVLALTLLMCVLSGCLAIRRLLAADPAELF